MCAFGAGNAVEQLAELGIVRFRGILGILVDAELFLVAHILEQGHFLLSQLHGILLIHQKPGIDLNLCTEITVRS